MGVAISTQSALAPISLGSTIIGFISFAFTLATAFKVFWDNLSTFFGAPTEIQDLLTNLRQSLYEERTNLKRARQYVRKRRQSAAAQGQNLAAREKGELGPEAALQAMSTAIKHMITTFKKIEHLFLADDLQPERRRRREKDGSADEAAGYTSGLGEDEQTDYLYAANRYKKCGFRERCLWIKYKSSASTLMGRVANMEIRRIGLQISHMSLHLRDLSLHFDDFDDRLDGLDRLKQRMNRVVGVRRVE